ncbi:MAG: hypothetical protein H6624_16445 [Bdellovibrionaceae bacterium]|nr:hypothetical protein [Bdellovibrionales bacterium]MCB9085937.1 hypothetical protein [Pseudobdellovibrionaceae bacterium]
MRSLFFLFVFLIYCIAGTDSLASTFVGNGGNAGDVELLVTIRQIRGAAKSINVEGGRRDLCDCAHTYENHRICEGLNDLDEAQGRFCTQVLRKNSGVLFDLIRTDDAVTVKWTHEAISVKEEGDVRAADAVANPQDKTITLNQARFLELSPSERVFLLAHELMHFTSWEEKRIQDRGSIGPFTSNQGQRKLLNAMAAGLVMEVDRQDLFNQYKKTLKRPQGWKRHWLDLGFGSVNRTGGSIDNTYYLDSYSSTDFSYRYYWSSFGLILNSHNGDESDKILTSITASESLSAFGVGLTYRYFPGSDPLTTSGQAQIVASALLEHLTSEYEVSDPFVGIQSKDTSLGLALECKYFIPLKWGMWGFAGGRVSVHDYAHPDLGLKYESIRYSLNLGASYAF